MGILTVQSIAREIKEEEKRHKKKMQELQAKKKKALRLR